MVIKCYFHKTFLLYCYEMLAVCEMDCYRLVYYYHAQTKEVIFSASFLTVMHPI